MTVHRLFFGWSYCFSTLGFWPSAPCALAPITSSCPQLLLISYGPGSLLMFHGPSPNYFFVQFFTIPTSALLTLTTFLCCNLHLLKSSIIWRGPVFSKSFCSVFVLLFYVFAQVELRRFEFAILSKKLILNLRKSNCCGESRSNFNKVTLLCYKNICFNPYQSNVSLLYPLKTTENLWFSVVFWGNRNGTLG